MLVLRVGTRASFKEGGGTLDLAQSGGAMQEGISVFVPHTRVGASFKEILEYENASLRSGKEQSLM